MKKLLGDIKACTICEPNLELGARPVVSASPKSKILIVGQAPGTKVHKSGIPWDDPSGKLLRKWLAVDESQFYNNELFGIVPMGFCYPGKGKTGDLPPRKECAPQWHEALISEMRELEFMVLIGAYAQKYYLGAGMKRTLTETVASFEEYLPKFIPLPHPSPRNRYWLMKNPWFEETVIPVLRQKVKNVM